MSILPLPHAAASLALASQLLVRPAADFDLTRLTVFHESVEFKLRCAEYYLNQLEDTLEEFPFTSYRRSPDLFKVNLYVDGFLGSVVSAAEVFGRELNSYFDNAVQQTRFYFHDVVSALQQAGRAAGLVAHLLPSVDPTATPPGLIPKLKKYRNCSMHSRLIETATAFTATITYADQQKGTAPLARPICYLPDDPAAVPCGYARQIEVVGFCNRALIDVGALLDTAYDHLTNQLNTAAHVPL